MTAQTPTNAPTETVKTKNAKTNRHKIAKTNPPSVTPPLPPTMKKCQNELTPDAGAAA